MRENGGTNSENKLGAVKEVDDVWITERISSWRTIHVNARAAQCNTILGFIKRNFSNKHMRKHD